ncbi:MAG: choice-of-anchor R domain-containing protein [Promethearchaeota archaeon]
MSSKARIQKKRMLIKGYFFISLLMLSLLIQMSFLQIIADSQSSYDLKNDETDKKTPMNEIEESYLKNNESLNRQKSDLRNKARKDTDITPIATNSDNLNSIDRSRRSPPTSNGVSEAGFDIQEYVVANSSQLNVSTSNTWGDQATQQNLTHIAAYDVKNPTNKSGAAFQFIPNQSNFNITDVIATKDFYPIENKTTDISTEKSTKWSAVAQNFTVTSRMRLFSVWLYIAGSPQGPDMNVTICEDDSGHPGTVLAFEHIMDITISLSWFQVNFSSPPILSANTKFWIVLSHTDTQGSLRWGYQTNPGIPDYGGMLYNDTDWVGPNTWSMPLIIQVCRIDGSNQPLTYSTPTACGMIYGGGNLGGFTNIAMNTTVGINDQVFQTNVAVVFNVTWLAKYQSQVTHQVQSLEYLVSDDASLAEWNITFASSGVNSSYNLRNYNLTWTLVPTDWEIGDLFQGTTDVTTDLTPTKNGRTWSIVNRSVLTGMANFSEIIYRLEATSPNYVNHVTVSHLTRNLTQNLNVTTSFNASIQPNDVSKFNVSILFPNGTEIIVNSTINQTTISQDTSVPLLSDYPNGTYQFIITYWNGTEVGLNISTFVKVYTPTSLTIISETTELTVESAYNLTLSFWDIAKDTGVKGSSLNVTIDPDWTNAYKKVPNNGTDGFFSVSIPTTGQIEGLYTIMIYANALYHINQTDSRESNFVGLIDSELGPPHYPTNIYYTDTFRLWITFNESESTNPIANATVVVTCSSMGIDNKAMLYNVSGFYYLDIQTTGNDTINHNFNITASKTSYQPQTQLFSIGILENPTNLIGTDSSGPIINGSLITSLYFNESYIVEFQYNDTQHDITIDETPTVQFSMGGPLQYVTGTDGENKTVLFTLNETGQHKVLISFTPTLGYNSQIFNLTLDIFPIQTSTQGQNGTQNVVFGTSYTFWIQYWDDLNSKGITGVNPAIEGPATFDSDDGAGNYTFIFDISLTQIETYSVNITFSKTGYVTQAIELTFTVIPRDTSIVSISEPYNESTVYLVYGNAYTISLNVTDEENSTVMDYLIEDNFTITNVNWDGFLTYYDFMFPATALGQTLVTIQLAVYGFENSSWHVTFEVAHVPTNFTSAQLSGNQTVNLVFEQGYYFNVSIGDENHSTWITDITPDNTQPGIPYLYFLGIVDNYYSFLFNYSYVKLGSFGVNVTWIKTGYQTQHLVLVFEIAPRDTRIVSTSEPYNESTVYLVYGNAYTISLNVTDEENGTVMDYLIENNFTLTNINWNGFLTYYDFMFPATALSQTQVTIQLAVYGFENSSWRVTFEVAHVPTNFTSVQLSGNQTVNLVFEQGYYFNVSIGDENHSTWITDITPDNTQPGIPYLYFLGIVDKYYLFLFNYSYIKLGSFGVNVTWIKTGYQTQHLVLVFEIAPRDTHIVSTSGELNESSVHLIYGNAYTITLTITDQENGTQMNYLIAENFTLININLDGATTYNFTFPSMTLGETQVKIQLAIYGFVNRSWVVTFNVAPVPTDLTGTMDDGAPITNKTSILVYYKNSFGLNLTWTDTNHSLGVSTISTTETVNSTVIPTLWITNVYPDSGSYDYHIYPYDDDYLGFWIITVTLEKYGYLNKTWILYVQVEPRPTILSASLTNGTTFTNESVLHFLIEENITFHLDWTDVNSSTPISSPTVVPTSNPIGALTKLSNFDFSVSSSSEGILPRSVTVTITYSKGGYVSQAYYIVFIVHGRSTSITGQTPGNIDLYFGESISFWIVYNDTTENKWINNATVEISGFLTLLGGSNIGNYTFIFNHSLIEIGSFPATISLSRSGYDKQEVILNFEVFERPTVLLASIQNGTLLTLDYQNNTYVWVALNDTRTKILILIENVLELTITGSIGFNLSFYQLTYGSNITLNLLAYDLGNFNIILEVHKYGYVKQAIEFSLIVNTLETIDPVILGSSSSTILADYNFSALYWWFDTYARNISDAIIAVYINGTKLNESEKEVWIEPIPLYGYYDITINTTRLDAGNYNITISFSKYGYQTSLAETELILLAHVIDVTFEYPNSVNIGEDLIISVQLTDLNVTTTPEQVKMTTDWDYGWTFDNSSLTTGTYRLILSTIGTTPGEYSNILIYYTGFQIQSGNISITFNSLGSFLISGLKDESQYINETQDFIFSIKDHTGTFHSDLKVWWGLVGTTKTGNATNLGNGQYQIEVECSELLTGQTYTLEISAEKSYYVPLFNQTTLKILAKYITILDWAWEEPPSSFTQGEELVLEVKLLFDNDTPVIGEIVDFTIIIQYKDKSSVPTKRSLFNTYGQQYDLFFIMSLDAENTLTLNMSDRTDDKGVARVEINETYTKNAIGLVSIQVSYSGSKGLTDSRLSMTESIAILPPQGGGGGVDPMWIIVAAVMAAIFVLSGAIYVRTREKKKDIVSRKKFQAYQELIEIVGMRHLLISSIDGVGIYSETFFQQVTSETSPMLAGLITALDSFVQELSKEKAEYSQLKRENFNMISRRGKYTQITLISECSATEITKKRLRETQIALETKYEDVLKSPMIDLSRMPIQDLSDICKQHLYTNLLYGLTVNEEQMVLQWKGLNKLERKAVQAARRSIQLTDHSTLYLNSWVSEMRLLGVDESDILKGIFAVTDRKIVHIKVETGL